jgi:hypothetical protein
LGLSAPAIGLLHRRNPTTSRMGILDKAHVKNECPAV